MASPIASPRLRWLPLAVGSLLFVTTNSLGQEQPRTVSLDTIYIKDRAYKPFLVGRVDQRLDSTLLGLNRFANMGQLLQQLSTIPVRQYGNGMLSTLSMRGLGPSHTAVNWNGFTINSPMLGQQDLSLVPGISFNEAVVQWGTTSALVGTDAAAGSIILNSKPLWRAGFNGDVGVRAGSFGSSATQGSVQYAPANLKWISRTAYAWSTLRNNFPYRNTSRFGTPMERQQNAGLRQLSLVQDLYRRLGNHYLISVNAWYSQAHRQLQPAIGASASGEEQADKSFRLVTSLAGSRQATSSSLLQLALFAEQIHYQNPLSQINDLSKASQAIIRYERQWQLTMNNAILHLKAGTEGAVARALVPDYGDKATQYRGDGYLLTTWESVKGLRASAQIRKGWVTGFDPPFIPSLGVDYTLLQTSVVALHVRGNLSRVYRIPTLNDRYWRPGGNPLLRPESGWSREGGISLLKTTQTTRLEFNLTAFHNQLTNRILWQPVENAGYWSARNLQEVRSRGLEGTLSLGRKLERRQWLHSLGITYTRATQEKALTFADQLAIGKQLIYTPFIVLNQQNRLTVGGWVFSMLTTYSGKQYTLSDNSRYLPGFLLADAQLSRRLKHKQYTWVITLSGRNLTNSTYQVVENKAMPRRNGDITVQLTFN